MLICCSISRCDYAESLRGFRIAFITGSEEVIDEFGVHGRCAHDGEH